MQHTYLRELASAHKEFYSEVCTIAQLILVMPATNATSKRSFSAKRRVKTYLRSTMHQQRLNHLMFTKTSWIVLILRKQQMSLFKEVSIVYQTLANFKNIYDLIPMVYISQCK